jgi:hypothetical protein
MSRQKPALRPRDRAVAWGLSAAVHLGVLAALFWFYGKPQPAKPEPDTNLVMVNVAPQPAPQPPGPPIPDEALAASAPEIVQPTPPRPVITTRVVVAATTEKPDNSDLLSDAQLAGAASAGEGSGGGGGGGSCDTARAVQQALRKDPLVRTAVQDAGRTGKAVMLWNGDWVRTGGQEGKGLSAVREAVMWHIAFIPEACRNERMHGMVVLSLADGSTRFAIGSGDWRWSDLLGLRAASR